MSDYIGKHRPTPERAGSLSAFAFNVGGSTRDMKAQREGYHYLPRHATPEVTEASVMGMTR